jgi:hypothetical protein
MFEIGTSLREARVRQGIEFPEAEHTTKVRGKYLRALEDEQFDILPAETYVKGFLRTYADYLGLDGQLYVDEFNSRYVIGEEELPTRPRRSTAGRAHRKVESRVVMLALVGIAVVTALVIAAWKFGAPSAQHTGAGQTPSAPPVVAPKAHKAVAGPKTTVSIWAQKGDTGLQVWRGATTTKMLYTGTLQRGQAQRFVSTKPLFIKVGKPDMVHMTVNGRPALLAPQWGLYMAGPKGLTRAPAGG